MDTVYAIVLAAVGSSGLFAFLQFLFQRKDKKKDQLSLIERRLNKLEKDTCRIQMLILIQHNPEQKREILTLSEHYFKDLHANWYMEDIFSDWLNSQGVEHPVWFKNGVRNE